MIHLTKGLCPPEWDDIRNITQDLITTLDCIQDASNSDRAIRPAIARAIADMRAEKSYSIQVTHYTKIIQDFKTFWVLGAGLA